MTLKVNAGSLSVNLYKDNGSWDSLGNFSVNMNNAERHIYYYLDNSGKKSIVDSAPTINQSVVLFKVRPGNAPANNEVTVEPEITGNYAKIQRNEPNGVIYESQGPTNVKVFDGTSYVLSTNVVLKVNNTTSFKVYNTGDPYILYLYTDLDGKYTISTEQWQDYSKLSIRFLENIEGNQIALSDGNYYINGNMCYGHSGNNTSFFTETYGKNKGIEFKYLQDSTLYIEGNQYTLGNDGGSHEVTYYNGNFYNNYADAVTQYQKDHAGQSVFDGNVTIHFSKTQVVKHNPEWGDPGNPTGGYVVGGNEDEGWKRTTDQHTYAVAENTNLSISLYTVNSGYILTKTFTYSELASGNVTDIWISYDKFNTSKPSDWQD
jgi:hypothetical protein